MPTDTVGPRQAAAPRNTPGNGGEEPGWKRFITMFQQVLIFWVIMQFVTRYFAGSTTTQPTTSPDGAPTEPVNPFLLPPVEAYPAWELGQTLSIHVYLSTSPTGDVFWSKRARQEKASGTELPSVVWENITYGDWKETRSVQFNVTMPEWTRHNGSLWADVFLVKDGASPDPNHDSFDPVSIHHIRKLLTPYLAREKAFKVKNLLHSKNETSDEQEEPADVIVPHWNSNLTLALISDATVVPYGQALPVILEHVHLLPGRDSTGSKGTYKPIVFPNDFWHLRSQYVEVNTTTLHLPLRITFQPMSYMKFQIFASLTQGFNEAAKKQGGGGAELDEVKRMLVETNPWFLGLTALVSVLHMVFEMLAFKSDVSHWRQKQELVGVSVRTIVTNVVVQIIVLLYLMDNNADTSWMILLGSGVGVLVEAWKITKAVDIRVIAAPPGSTIPYKLDIRDKHVLSEDEKKTQEYDKLAFRYVSYVAIPCLAGYTIYSLLYGSHKGWYSFVISTLTSFVYMFGFAQLVPQLIINYKLKSVAHMPMKAMIYKTLSTVVDDFFAFCIKMPFLHRLACFRDDVVFLVFLYQRWIYRIDPKRVNEYGQVLAADAVSVEGEEETKKDK